MKILTMGVAWGIASLSLAAVSGAAVTDIRLYHLGEADVPAAVPLGPGDPVTVDSASGVNASKVGLTTYNGSGGVGPPVGVGIAPGSTKSMRFQNVDSRYVAPAVTGLIGNFDATTAGFAGVVDEARVFTFAPGAFNPTTDLGGAAVPEPAAFVLLSFGWIGLLGRRRR